MKTKIVLTFLLMVISTSMLYANQCSDFFPGPRPIAGLGSIDVEIEDSVRCNGSSNCALVAINNKRSPTLPSNTVNLGTFYLNSVQDYSYNAYRSWHSSVNSVSVVSGTAVLYFNAQGNEIEIPENARINVGGDPSSLLIVVYNGSLEIGEGAIINAYIYADTEEVEIEENVTINGGLTVTSGELEIDEDVTLNFEASNSSFNPHDFCEFATTPTIPDSGPSCSAVFPGPTTFSAKGSTSIGKNTRCNGGTCSPINNFTVPSNPGVSPSGSFRATNISDGVYEHISWGLSKGAVVRFSGSGTAVLYFAGSVSIPKETRINAGGAPSNVMIIAAGSISIAKDSVINAHIYAGGSISIDKDNYITGSVSASGSLSVDKDGVFVYNSGDADNITGHGFCGGAVAPAVDHYLITHDGHGLTCASEQITIQACTNSFGTSCTESTDAVSLNLVATGASGHSVTIPVNFSGNTSVDLKYTVPEIATLSINNAGVAAANGYRCNNGNVSDCNLKFDNAGFTISGFNMVNGSPMEVAGAAMGSPNVNIQAVKDDGTGACQPYFTGAGQRDIGFAVQVPSGSLKYTIDGQEISTLGNGYTSIPLSFNAQSFAELPTNIYYDATDIVLHATHTIPATLENPAVTLTGSQGLYVRPDKFIIEANSGGNSLDSADHTGSNIHAAGKPFDLTITAVNAQDTQTPSFTRQIGLALERIGPLDPVGAAGSTREGDLVAFNGIALRSQVGAFVVSDSFPKTYEMTGGKYTSSGNSAEATYSEVGVVKLYVKDNTSGSVAFGKQIIGRFTPDHFTLDLKSMPLVTEVKNACGDMTYMSQPMLELGYRVIAENGFNTPGITKNYVGDYIKSTVTLVAENNQDNINRNAPTERLIGFDGGWSQGEYKSVVDNIGMFTRKASEVDGPFDQMRFGIKVVDSDGVALKSLDMLTEVGTPTAKAFSTTDSKIRFGRWVIENAYGPETSVLPVNMQVEFWDGTTWQTNELDNCTALIEISSPTGRKSGAIYSGGLADGEYRLVELNSFNYGNTKGATIRTNTQFDQGRLVNKVIFDAAGENNTPKLKFEYQVPEWLQYDWQGNSNFTDNPISELQFGLFRGNDRIISWREVGN
ncbi:DUF6701 domain-containing protein [Thalassotalea marina]|uniref:DUF6701 domain-containing protein n=1 Tax=Thalassotalea marina TaxID=1673741 RepID=A0A919BCU5_9GAMM|nr:DUF6701 domain-containing protein [Thalassotalea marina]GHF82878.1 hypothetical protein GCM10017161_07640 [Thalassotalea marina]